MGSFIVSTRIETVGQGNNSVLGQVVLVAEQLYSVSSFGRAAALQAVGEWFESITEYH